MYDSELMKISCSKSCKLYQFYETIISDSKFTNFSRNYKMAESQHFKENVSSPYIKYMYQSFIFSYVICFKSMNRVIVNKIWNNLYAPSPFHSILDLVDIS